MTRRFPTTSTAVVTTTTVDSVGATQGARGVPDGPAPADPDQLGRAASLPASEQLAAELFSGIPTLPEAQGEHCVGHSSCRLLTARPTQRVLARGGGWGGT